VWHLAEDQQVLLLWENFPASHGDDVHQKRWHDTLLLFCSMPKEPSRISQRSAETQMDNVLWEERARLNELALAWINKERAEEATILRQPRPSDDAQGLRSECSVPADEGLQKLS